MQRQLLLLSLNRFTWLACCVLSPSFSSVFSAETFTDSWKICDETHLFFNQLRTNFEVYASGNTWSFCSCFLRFAASFFFRFFRCFAVSSFSASPSAMLDLLSELIQSNQRTLKYFNQRKGEDVANQMSR